MGAAHELVLTVGRGSVREELHTELTTPMDVADGQCFTCVCKDQNLDGSGQAGSATVYVLSLRHTSTYIVVDEVTRMFERTHAPEGVLVVTGDYIFGPAEVHRVGYQPSSDPKDWL